MSDENPDAPGVGAWPFTGAPVAQPERRPAPENRTCETCQFWRAHWPRWGSGNCTRWPPGMFGHRTTPFHATCGEWRGGEGER